MRGVEIDDRLGKLEASGAIAFQQFVAHLARAEATEIHQEKGEIAGNIGAANGDLELDAVVDLHGVRFEADVLAAEIAMALAQPFGKATFEQITLIVHERAHGAVDEGELFRSDDVRWLPRRPGSGCRSAR